MAFSIMLLACTECALRDEAPSKAALVVLLLPTLRLWSPRVDGVGGCADSVGGDCTGIFSVLSVSCIDLGAVIVGFKAGARC